MSFYHKIAVVFAVAAFSCASTASASVGLLFNDKGGMMLQIEDAAGNHLYGEEEGAALSGSFRSPTGLAVGPNNQLYIADTDNHKIRQLTSGRLNTFAGPTATMLRDSNELPLGALRDGNAKDAFFDSPSAIAYGADGSLYIADSGNHSIRKIMKSGKVITLAGNGQIGSADGSGTSATFFHPEGIAVSSTGVVYVADTLNHTIREIQPNGTTRTLTASSKRIVEGYPGYVMTAGDYRDGAIRDSLFNEPTGLAIDTKGNLFVSDTGNQRIRYMNFQTNQVTTVAGAAESNTSAIYEKNAPYAKGGYTDGPARSAAFRFPKGIALDSSGGLFIVDSLNNAIRYLKNGRVSTVAGSPTGASGSKNGIESTALFDTPQGIAVARDGTIYVADTGNNAIRMLSPYRLPADIAKNQSIHIVVEDQKFDFEAPPETKSGTIMVPVRKISEFLGYSVSTEDQGKTVRLQKENSSVELSLGSTVLKYIEKDKDRISKVTVAPYVKNNRTYVPLRFIAEEARMDVQWDKNTQTVILRHKEK